MDLGTERRGGGADQTRRCKRWVKSVGLFIRPELIPGFLNVKQLGVFTGTHLYCLVHRDALVVKTLCRDLSMIDGGLTRV